MHIDVVPNRNSKQRGNVEALLTLSHPLIQVTPAAQIS